MAITDSDSTIVYYRIASGFLPPELQAEEEKEQKSSKRKRRKKAATVETIEDKLDPFQEEELWYSLGEDWKAARDGGEMKQASRGGGRWRRLQQEKPRLLEDSYPLEDKRAPFQEEELWYSLVED